MKITDALDNLIAMVKETDYTDADLNRIMSDTAELVEALREEMRAEIGAAMSRHVGNYHAGEA